MNEPPRPTDQSSDDSVDPQSEARIQRILRQSQREAGARDVLTFALGKAWSVLLIIGAAFVVTADLMARNDGESKE